MPNTLPLGPIQIPIYSLLILLSFLIAYYNLHKLWDFEHLDELLLNLIIGAFIGARLYYVIFQWDYYQNHPLEIPQIWQGGIAIYGGVIGGTLVLYYYSRKKHYPSFYALTDLFAPTVLLGQAIGRWGNFFNQEAFGPVVSKTHFTYLPNWIQEQMLIDGAYRMPTFLYESIPSLIIALFLLYHQFYKPQPEKWNTSIYLIGYGITRYFIEIQRTDSLMLGPYKVSVLVSIFAVSYGLYLLIQSREVSQL